MSREPIDNEPRDDASERDRSLPCNGEAELQVAVDLIEQGRLDEAAQYAGQAAQRVTRDSPILERLGTVLFELGQFFPLAYTALEQAVRNGPVDAAALGMLAALYHRTGESGKERDCMALMARQQAVVGPRLPQPGLPAVLRIRSLENSYFGIKASRRNGLYSFWLKGGHFSSKHLTDSGRINLYVATVFGDNLNAIGELPDFDVFINTVACADRDPGGLQRIQAFLDKYPDVPVVNHPEKVRRTTRVENARRLSALPGVRMPRTELFPLNKAAPAVAADIESAGFEYPMIVRHQGTQTGKTVKKVDTRADLLAWLSKQPSGTLVHAIAYVDCRGQGGLYRKTRAFFIDGTFYPVAHLSSDTWQIHSGDRYRVMSSMLSAQEEEQRYLSDPETHLGPQAFRALHAIRDTIDLDFFGIDFTIDPDQNVLVFEANAAMRHNFDHAASFPYTRPHLQRISRAFADMLDRRAVTRAEEKSVTRRASAGGKRETDMSRISLSSFLGDDGELSMEAEGRLVAALIAALKTAPYWVVLSTEKTPLELEMLETVLRTIGDAGQPPGGQPQRLSRTRIRVDPGQADRRDGVTRYSRTADALPLHTDCSNQRNPPNLVTFAMERPDSCGGGASRMLSAQSLAQAIPTGLLDLLREPLFPFARDRRFPIIEGDLQDLRIRYYRNQIDSAMEAGAAADRLVDALNALDEHLASAQSGVQFPMQAGDVLMMDNTRVLHGRCAMPVDSDRLMYRFRLSSAALAGRHS